VLLPDAITRAIGSPSRHAEAREACRTALFGELTDGRAGERLAERIAALPRAERPTIS